MARLYRLFLLIIALVTVQPSLALPEDGPGKPNPSKSRILKSADSTDLLSNRGPIEPLRSRLFLKDQKPTGPDPIRFTMRASKDSVAIGEEFEITITAELLNISPQSMFFFEEQKAFALKVLKPEGFVQTGGDYYDYIGSDFRQGGITLATYKLRGRLTHLSAKASFTLLRGPRDASANSLFEKKQELTVKTILIADTSSKARQAATVPTGCQLPYQTSVVRRGPTVDGMTSLTILVQNAASSYLYSADSVLFSPNNVVRVVKSSGYVFVRDGQYAGCSRKIAYTIKKASGSVNGGQTNVVPEGGDNCPVNAVSIDATSTTICSDNENSSSSVDIFLYGCSTSIVWYKDGTIYSGPGSATVITVNSAGTYKGTCYVSGCSDPYDSAPVSITENCTALCQGKSTAPEWKDLGQWRCTGFNVEIMIQDTNQCSLTHNRIIWKEFAQNNCLCYPANQQISGPSEQVCIGSTVTLIANNCNNSGTIVWSNGATGSSTTFYAPNVNTTYTFTCSYPASSSCLRTSSSFTLQVKTCTNDPCAGQSTTSQWVNSGQPYCNNGIQYQDQYDANSCSTNTVRTRTQSTTGSCTTNPCDNITVAKPTITGQLNLSGSNPSSTLTASNCIQSARWYRGDNNTQFTQEGTTFTFTNPYDGFSVYAKCVEGNGACVGAASDPVTFTVTTSCTGQSTTAVWVNVGDPTCSNGTEYQAKRDNNPCSTTYNTLTAVQTGNNGNCSTCSGVVKPTISAQLSSANGTTTWTLTATGCTGQNVRWYPVGQGAYSPDRNPIVFTNPEANVTVYATCILGDCESKASDPLTYTVTADPCMSMSSFTPTVSARVVGTSSSQSLTLTASNCPTGSLVRWYGPNSTTATGSIWIPSFSQTSDYAAVCLMSNGCQSQPGQIHVTFKNPQAPLIQTTATQLCAGESVTLTATGCPTNVRWSTGQTGSPLVLTPSATTSYWAYCIDDEVVGNLASTAVQVTVANSLTVNGRTDYTIGETISLTAVSSVQGATYTWYGPSGFSQTGQVLQRLGAAVSQSGNYTVIATSGQGCAGKKTVPISVTASAFSCTCQDCDLPAVSTTDNPGVPATNKGSLSQNFVQESVYLDEGGSSVVQTISYFDGLGRPIQKVNVATGGKTDAVPTADVVQPITYDAFGREPTKYLPYAAATNNGAFRSVGTGAVSGYYVGLPDKTGTAFLTITYEASPLNRVLYQTAPGSGTPVKMAYRTNTASELPLLTYDFSTNKINVDSYGASQLYVTESTDENQNKTIEYKDKDGRVVGKSVAGVKTLYAYDDLGHLRCVVPPKAIGAMGSSFDPFAGDLLFAYDYDSRGRMSRKKVPGAGVTTMTFDLRDRLETSTDAKGTTITTAYDGLDRVIATKQGDTFLTKTFYDNYSQADKGFDGDHAYGQTRLPGNPKGMVTGTWTAVLDATNLPPLVSNTYYDDLGRVIQTVADNHKGGVDHSSSLLDYVGRVTDSRLTTLNGLVVENRTRYDAGSRVKSVCQKIIDGATDQYWEPVARHSYNGIGELTKKILGCGIQTVDYTYQMRGWLSKMNDPDNLNQGTQLGEKDFFGMKLSYDGVGNISQWDYRNAQRTGFYSSAFTLTPKEAYSQTFGYDALNRLQTANLTKNGTGVFSLANGYDDNGNITSLNRMFNGNPVDALTYNYPSTSNQLSSITDAATNPSTPNEFFAGGNSTYTYDPNGNLTSDLGKGITSISYNYLNLPQSISKSGQSISYMYSAAGQKLKVNFGTNKTYDYVGGLVYDKDGLEFIPTAEGRVLPPQRAINPVDGVKNSFWRYEYQLKDHLGNLRVACRCAEKPTATSVSDAYAPVVVQENHYDAWGLSLPLNPESEKVGGNPADRFTYNSKERQEGLGWLDYGARMYDPTVSRWLQVDPLTEEQEAWSPYNFTYNNPINYIDLYGLSPTDFSENSAVAICPTCPKDSKYDEYRNSKSLYTYDKETGFVLNGDGIGTTIYGTSAQNQANRLFANPFFNPNGNYNKNGAQLSATPYRSRLDGFQRLETVLSSTNSAYSQTGALLSAVGIRLTKTANNLRNQGRFTSAWNARIANIKAITKFGNALGAVGLAVNGALLYTKYENGTIKPSDYAGLTIGAAFFAAGIVVTGPVGIAVAAVGIAYTIADESGVLDGVKNDFDKAFER